MEAAAAFSPDKKKRSSASANPLQRLDSQCGDCGGHHDELFERTQTAQPGESCARCSFWRSCDNTVHERRYACGTTRPTHGLVVARPHGGAGQLDALCWPEPMVRHDPACHGPAHFGGSFMCLQCLRDVASNPALGAIMYCPCLPRVSHFFLRLCARCFLLALSKGPQVTPLIQQHAFARLQYTLARH